MLDVRVVSYHVLVLDWSNWVYSYSLLLFYLWSAWLNWRLSFSYALFFLLKLYHLLTLKLSVIQNVLLSDPWSHHWFVRMIPRNWGMNFGFLQFDLFDSRLFAMYIFEVIFQSFLNKQKSTFLKNYFCLCD